MKCLLTSVERFLRLRLNYCTYIQCSRQVSGGEGGSRDERERAAVQAGGFGEGCVGMEFGPDRQACADQGRPLDDRMGCYLAGGARGDADEKQKEDRCEQLRARV